MALAMARSATAFSSIRTSSAAVAFRIAGQTFTVNQSTNNGCEYSLSPAGTNNGSAGGFGSVNVTAASGCLWFAESSAPWLAVIGSLAGVGNGTINFSVGPNTGFARTATLSIAGHEFVVKQSAKFGDIDPNGEFTTFIEKLSAEGITVGCGQDFFGRPLYCPTAQVTRDQMSAFIIRALGMPYPPSPGLQRFQDVLPSNPFFAFIDQMAARGITVGCHPPGNPVALYCPGSYVTRDQMAAFIIRALGMPNPPAPSSQRFLDVPPSSVFYAFIDQMALRSITLGCDPAGTMYCPHRSSHETKWQPFS